VAVSDLDYLRIRLAYDNQHSAFYSRTLYSTHDGNFIVSFTFYSHKTCYSMLMMTILIYFTKPHTKDFEL